MSYISVMIWCLLAAAVAPRTGKIIKIGQKIVFERGKKIATKWYIKLYIFMVLKVLKTRLYHNRQKVK